MNGALPGNIELSDAQAACVRGRAGALLGSVAAGLAVSVGGGYLGYRAARKVRRYGRGSLVLQVGGALLGWFAAGRLVASPLIVQPAVRNTLATCNIPFPVST